MIDLNTPEKIDLEGIALILILPIMLLMLGTIITVNSCVAGCHDEIVPIRGSCSHGAKGTITKFNNDDVLLCSCQK